MRRLHGLIIAPLLVLAAAAALAVGVGDRAPDFTGGSTMGEISLADYRGVKNVVLAFYIKDFTGG